MKFLNKIIVKATEILNKKILQKYKMQIVIINSKIKLIIIIVNNRKLKYFKLFKVIFKCNNLKQIL